MEENLKKWQILYIDNEKYTVANMIEYQEDTWIWQEYEIRSPIHGSKWLCVEKEADGKNTYAIYRPYYKQVNEAEMFLNIEGVEYELYEKGMATVKNYFGNADVDIQEKCEYIDYITKDKKYVISVEIWDTEVERSKGEYIDSTRIRITDEIDEVQAETEKRNKNRSIGMNFVLPIVIVLCILVPYIIAIVPEWFVNKSIQKYLEKQPDYTYITSITNNVNRKKAKVYKSPYTSIDQTVKNIIDGVPEGITETIDAVGNTNEDGIGLRTSKEFAYVYEEEEEIYVQVSEKEYVDNSAGTLYHGGHYGFYTRTFNSTRKSNTYTEYSDSARQQSINSRISSGGGTSAGK